MPPPKPDELTPLLPPPFLITFCCRFMPYADYADIFITFDFADTILFAISC
jgi:hypothetical protein